MTLPETELWGPDADHVEALKMNRLHDWRAHQFTCEVGDWITFSYTGREPWSAQVTAVKPLGDGTTSYTVRRFPDEAGSLAYTSIEKGDK